MIHLLEHLRELKKNMRHRVKTITEIPFDDVPSSRVVSVTVPDSGPEPTVLEAETVKE